MPWTPPALMIIPWWNVWPVPGFSFPAPTSRAPQQAPYRSNTRRPNSSTFPPNPPTTSYISPRHTVPTNQKPEYQRRTWAHPNPYGPLQQLDQESSITTETYHWPNGQVKPRTRTALASKPPPNPSRTIELRPLHHHTCRGYFLPGP